MTEELKSSQSEPSSVPSERFKDSVRTLFALGQFPVIVISVPLIWWISYKFHAPLTWYAFVALTLGFCSTLISLAAVLSNHELKSRILLGISLVFAVAYLHMLVGISGGSKSLFVHMYLYLPAVVFMVTRKTKWAEYLSAILVFISYLTNFKGHFGDISSLIDPYHWDAWDSFRDWPFFWCFEVGIFTLLMVFLLLVNIEMERIHKKYQNAGE